MHEYVMTRIVAIVADAGIWGMLGGEAAGGGGA